MQFQKGPASPEDFWEGPGLAVGSGAGSQALTQPDCRRATRTYTATVSALSGPARTVACTCP